MKGADVRKIRERLGWTQAQLAEALGVAPNTVARWERDELGMRATAERLLIRIAEDHGIPGPRR